MTRFSFIIFMLSLLLSVIFIILAILGIFPPIFFIFLFLPFVSTKKFKANSDKKISLFCPRCGYPLTGTENYCPRCGYRLR